MKVKELIEILEKLDKEKEISIRDCNGEPSNIAEIIYENDLFKWNIEELPCTDRYIIE